MPVYCSHHDKLAMLRPLGNVFRRASANTGTPGLLCGWLPTGLRVRVLILSPYTELNLW